MFSLAKGLQKFVAVFSKLPTIGSKSALKLGIWLIGRPQLINEMIEALMSLKRIGLCSTCLGIASETECEFCSDEKRDRNSICVVEKYTDIVAIENSKSYNGLYFCLGHLWAPVRGISVENLPVEKLLEMIKRFSAKEIILALPFTLQGDATAHYLHGVLSERFSNLNISRPARGLPKGAEIDQVDDYSLSYAFKFRKLDI
ncbi:MAG: recombination mediator RecR [Deltaproteobacteria bacterium]|nr:recombination mediator RecR [Deltaproteobacteria bacterium]